MNNNEYNDPAQVPTVAFWDIKVGDRHVSIALASPDMIKDTAAALSAAYPDEDVLVTSGLRVRYWFHGGSEVVKSSDILARTQCPYQSDSYRTCWEQGQEFPIEKWVSVDLNEPTPNL